MYKLGNKYLLPTLVKTTGCLIQYMLVSNLQYKLQNSKASIRKLFCCNMSAVEPAPLSVELLLRRARPSLPEAMYRWLSHVTVILE
jgi:hypothetical protein